MIRLRSDFRHLPVSRFVYRRCLNFKTFSFILLLVVFLIYVTSRFGDGLIFGGNAYDRRVKQLLYENSLRYEHKTQQVTGQKCVLPTLEADDPAMKTFYKKPEPIKCPTEPDWVYVDNGTLRFSLEAKKQFGEFICDYLPLIRKDGDEQISYGTRVTDVKDGFILQSDFFRVQCRTKIEPYKRYEDIHLGVSPNSRVKDRLAEVKPPANGLDGLSVLMMGFDSMSRMNWLRHMKKTRDYFINTLNGIELEGYNIMGDGTPAALFPIFTGKHEEEMHESRRNFKGAKPVDDFPWIWKDFAKAGYVTSWADAEVNMAPFNMRLLGFTHEPTDYYMRPYYLGVEQMKKSKKYAPNCRGPIPKHMIWFNWIKDLFLMYGNSPKFMMHFYATLSHDDINKIETADNDLQTLLTDLETRGYLNHTILVLMGDHGSRFSTVRATWAGKLEERLPYVSLRFPPWFHQKYPTLIRNLKINTGRLTTPLDLHETFRDVLKFDGAGIGNIKERGISLFKEIPEERECMHANISNHWCACLSWQDVDPNDVSTVKALSTAVDTINGFTAPYRLDCAELTIENVTFAKKVAANNDFLKFQRSGDRHGRVAVFDDKAKNEVVLYQMTFHTQPGHGHFEVTVTHNRAEDKMTVNEKEISRINKYGNASACIMDKNRQLRQYCYCNNNIQSKKPS